MAKTLDWNKYVETMYGLEKHDTSKPECKCHDCTRRPVLCFNCVGEVVDFRFLASGTPYCSQECATNYTNNMKLLEDQRKMRVRAFMNKWAGRQVF